MNYTPPMLSSDGFHLDLIHGNKFFTMKHIKRATSFGLGLEGHGRGTENVGNVAL